MDMDNNKIIEKIKTLLERANAYSTYKDVCIVLEHGLKDWIIDLEDQIREAESWKLENDWYRMLKEMEDKEEEKLEDLLVVGASIVIGKKYAEEFGGFNEGQIIHLVEGEFENDNGLFVETQTAPAWFDSETKEFHSIYHLFGNNFEYFYDCGFMYIVN